MKQQQPLSTSALEEAFQTFNQLSNQLAGSYHALEERVNELNGELARSQDARIHELNEKERLASRLSTLLQALPGGVVVLDENGCVQEFTYTVGGIISPTFDIELSFELKIYPNPVNRGAFTTLAFSSESSQNISLRPGPHARARAALLCIDLYRWLVTDNW